jgi:hypothetical protein
MNIDHYFVLSGSLENGIMAINAIISINMVFCCIEIAASD